MKVVIALAHNYRAFDKPFAMSLFKMQRYFYEHNGGELKIVYSEGLQLDEMREEVVRKAMTHTPDYVLMLDTDMDFPEDCIIKMAKILEKKKKYDAVCGIYCFRQEPYIPMLFKGWGDEGQGIDIVTEIPDKLFEIDCAGLGIIMVRSDFLRKCEDRLFRKTDTLGEEMYFFKIHRPKTLCDPSIDCGHYNLEKVNMAKFMKHNGIEKKDGKVEVPLELAINFANKLQSKSHFVYENLINKT